MARKTKPVSLHLVGGNKSHLTKAEIEARKKAEASLRPGNDKVRPPKWLGDKAKKEFRRIVREFQAVNPEFLANVDVDLLATYCDAYVDYQECTEEIARTGLMIEYTNKAGETNTIPNPLFTKKKALFDQMRACALEFGLTPSARAKLTLPKEPDKPETPFQRAFGDV